MGSTPTPQAIIGLKLDSIGIDQASSGAEKLAGHLQNVTKEITTIGVGVGVGGLLRDFVAIEGSAARTASYIGSITGGMSGYSGLAQSALGVQAKTGVNAGQTLGAMTMIAQLTGGRGLAGNPVAQQQLLGTLGMYGAAYQVDPTQLAGSLGPLLQSAGLGARASTPMLGMLAANANAGGMGNNFPSYLAGVSGMATSAVATNPGLSKYGGSVAGGLSTMYNQAAAGNPAYLNNPSLFQQGETAVSSALQGAYQNPRMTLALESMGISYADARQGLAGPQGQLNASKILKYSAAQYGEGTTYQDAWLRSNFGELVGTETLRAIAQGKSAGVGAATPAQRLASAGLISQRAAQGSTTPGANLERARGGIEHGVFGAVGGGLNSLFGLQAESPFGALAASYGAVKLLGKSRTILGALTGDGALAGVGGAIGEGALLGLGGAAVAGAGAAGLNQLSKETGLPFLGLPMKGLNALLSNPGQAISHAFGGWAQALGLSSGPNHPKALLPGEGGPGVVSHLAGAAMAEAEKAYGSGWLNNPKAQELVRAQIEGTMPFTQRKYEHFSQYMGGPNATARSEALGQVDKSIGSLREYEQLGSQGYWTKKFGESIGQFGEYVNKLKGNGSGGKNASYLSSTPGSLNAAGAQNVSDIVGSNMLLARLVGGGSASAGGGAQAASSTGSGSSSFASATSGGGWSPCTLTYYQPSAGGINGRSGGGAWSGHPVTDSTWGCAAPPAFAFGTQIAFSYGGKQVTVEVVDRGGAITGTRFDLLPGPARALGMVSAGRVSAGYKVVKSASSRPQAAGGGGGASSASPPASSPHAIAASAASFGGGAAVGGGTSGPMVHSITVNVDGRQMERQRRLVRGRAV